RERARDRDHERDHDGRTATVNENGGNHALLPAGFGAPAAPPFVGVRLSLAEAFMLDWISALAGPGETGWPGRPRCRPSTITLSPSVSPLMTAAMVGVDCPSWIRRCSALLSAPTVKT